MSLFGKITKMGIKIRPDLEPGAKTLRLRVGGLIGSISCQIEGILIIKRMEVKRKTKTK